MALGGTEAVAFPWVILLALVRFSRKPTIFARFDIPVLIPNRPADSHGCGLSFLCRARRGPGLGGRFVGLLVAGSINRSQSDALDRVKVFSIPRHDAEPALKGRRCNQRIRKTRS